MSQTSLDIPPNHLEAYWMPMTPNRRFKAAPEFFVEAKGMHYKTPEGRPMLDAIAGLWCVNAGHCHPRIIEAIRHQAGKLDYASSFSLGHPLAFHYTNRVMEIAPKGFDHIFLAGSGSEAVDTALKMSLAYHRARGEGHRQRLIGRQRSYHGMGFGGLSVSGIGWQRAQFGVMLPGVSHLPHTHDLTRNAFAKDLQITAIRGARRYRGDRLIRVARPHRLLDPKAGPLIAVRLRILTRKTLGGLHTDLSARVLREDGNPLPGLYAAGEVAGFGGGGMHGYRSLEGTFLGGCIFSGRAAGRAAADATA